MAVAHLLAIANHEVTLWEPIARDAEILRRDRSHPGRLRDFRLPDSVAIVEDPGAAAEADLVILAVASQYVRRVIGPLGQSLAGVPAIVNLAKGIENGTLERMSSVIAEETGLPAERVATLSGPSHAEEVVLGIPTTVVVASPSDDLNLNLQNMFSIEHFRVYTSDDIIGVELGGALKNIIAIAAGVADGLGLGDNTKGALITRGLAEITRLGLTLGARAETFAGLSGIGDLITTCMSRHSRNRLVGDRIGRGERLDDILKSMTMVAEGVDTCRSGYELALRHEVDMPITREIHGVLFDHKSPADAVSALMEREPRPEIWQ
ncbi:MAG: NAD(P)-dependent glycerol-3-phosphate dehydrogenase [candidate division Zixibacteria bacterium]|nr:NAD(P)-dependent glycerol-3-phosphate dehydrogenase [candidate division Zixibacteria bacterium]